METRWLTRCIPVLILIFAFAACDVRFIAGPAVVKHGEQVQYQLFLKPRTQQSASNATVYLTGHVPLGWSFASASYVTSVGGGSSGSFTVHPSDPGIITGLPPVPPNHQRVYLSAGPFSAIDDADAGTALLDFHATAAPGNYEMTFWVGVDTEECDDECMSFTLDLSVTAPSPPNTILADGLEFGTLAGWSSWRGLDGRTVAYYPLDGDATDHSFYGNHGTPVGDPVAAVDRWGKPGGALLFDGTEDQILVDDAPSLDLTDEMTLAAWIRPTLASGPWVVGKRDLSGGLFLYSLDISGGSVRGSFRDSGGTGWIAPGYSAIVQDEWQLLVVTSDGSDLVSYLDGIVQGHVTHSGALIGTGDGGVEIGSLHDARFGGVIDDVLIMNRALSFREVTKLLE